MIVDARGSCRIQYTFDKLHSDAVKDVWWLQYIASAKSDMPNENHRGQPWTYSDSDMFRLGVKATEQKVCNKLTKSRTNARLRMKSGRNAWKKKIVNTFKVLYVDNCASNRLYCLYTCITFPTSDSLTTVLYMGVKVFRGWALTDCATGTHWTNPSGKQRNRQRSFRNETIIVNVSVTVNHLLLLVLQWPATGKKELMPCRASPVTTL